MKAADQLRRPDEVWMKDIIDGSGASTGAGAAPAASGPAKFDINNVKSLPDLQAAYKAGNVTQAQAKEFAITKGWARAAPAAVAAAASPPVSR
jgi:hypothetical protein